MFTTRHPRRYLVPLVGTGFVLVSLFWSLTLPALSVSGVEATAYRDYQDHREYWGQRDYRDYRPYWRPRYELPDRYTIQKGKKCQLRCERIWGTRNYRCREYRC
jgi:hypothetical protein